MSNNINVSLGFDYVQKSTMFAYKLNFILFPQLIVTLSTLNNYACLLPPLVNVNCFSRVLDHINSQLVK